MKHVVSYSLSIAFLIGSITLMTSGNWLKKSFNENDRVLDGLQSMHFEVEKGNWERAEEEIQYVANAWHKVVNRIQFSVERNVINEITMTIYYMKGAIQAQDAKAIHEHSEYFKILWEEIGD